MPLELILYPHEVLREVCTPVEMEEIEGPTREGGRLFILPPEIKEFCEELNKSLYHYNGQGLAAPQVGKTIRVFSLLLSDEAICFINPEVTEFLGNPIKIKEGCLSLPGVRAATKCRNDYISIRATDLLGEEFDKKLMLIEAVAFQHELDHLDGKVLFNRMGQAQRQLKKNSYLKKIKKWRRYREQAR